MGQLTMISMELHLEVPQYMAIPWLITWVMALTVSSMTEQQQTGGTGQTRPKPRPPTWRPRPQSDLTPPTATLLPGAQTLMGTTRRVSWSTPTLDRGAGIRAVGKNHVDVVQLKSLERRPKT